MLILFSREENKVHRRSPIIPENINVGQINFRWDESAEDICKILKCAFLRGCIMRGFWPFSLFFGASIFKLTTSNMKFHEARYASCPCCCFCCWWLQPMRSFSFMMQFLFSSFFLAITVFEKCLNVPSTAKSSFHAVKLLKTGICNFVFSVCANVRC